ncbi:MAG: TM2 domain-containing protein [Bdellovibrionota bacterium]|mgnify:CR=1 FL=1
MNSEPGKDIWKRNKTIAILLAVFFGPWTWLYTYKRDPGKAAIGLGSNITTLVLTTLILVEARSNSPVDSTEALKAGEANAYLALFALQVLFFTWLFAIVITALRKEWYLDSDVPRQKQSAILIALFLGPWTWLYTYRKDYRKFWLAIIFGFGGILLSQFVYKTNEDFYSYWLFGCFVIWLIALFNSVVRKSSLHASNVPLLDPEAIITRRPSENTSSKSRFIAASLAFFLGTLGIHRLYVGKIRTGVVMSIVTIIGGAIDMVYYQTLIKNIPIGLIPPAAIMIWSLIDFCVIVAGRFKDKEGKYITRWGETVS